MTNPQTSKRKKSTPNEEPRIYWDRASKCWRLDHSMTVKIAKIRIEIHEGYATDLASVPAVFRPVLSTFGSFNRASVCHDFLYENQGVVDESAPLTRRECDRIFFDLMVIDGVPVWQAVTMWAAVRFWPLNHPFFKPWGDA